MNQSIEVLKNWFATGKKPSGKQFADLIDSCFNQDILNIEYSIDAIYWHSKYMEGDLYMRMHIDGNWSGAIRITGENGKNGMNGKDGIDGMNGKDGKDIYQEVVKTGYKGSEAELYQRIALNSTDIVADSNDMDVVKNKPNDSTIRITLDSDGKTVEKVFTISQFANIIQNLKP